MRRFAGFAIAVSLFSAACGKEDPPAKCEGDACAVVTENQAPTAKIKAPKIVRNGQKVTLDASASADPEGGKLKFLWIEGEKNPPNNFLDGLDLTAEKLTFTADVDGEFTYTLEVKDDQKQKATATVTLEVSTDYVPPDLKAPVITGVVINGVTFTFASTPAPVVFTTATGALVVKALGTDAEDDAASTPLTTLYSTNVTGPATGNGKTFELANAYDPTVDDDPFFSTEITVQLQDSDGLKSAVKTIEVRVVPRASAQLAPRAAFVDCAAVTDGDGLTLATPRNTLAGGYDTAKQNGLADVFVAVGECKGLQVDYHGIRLWGLFDPADTWRRMTEPIDKALNRVGSGGRRYALRSTIKDPTAYRLVYATGSTYTTGHLYLDGFSFELSGWNYYAVSLTVGTGSDTIDVGLFNNEFVGNVTSVTGTLAGLGWVPGGVLIQRNNSTGTAAGGNYFLRNLFAVGTTNNASVMQAWVDATVRVNKSAGVTHFYANVFTGAIKNSPTYRCNNYNVAAARVGFAFCFHNWNSFANVSRNSFWANTITSTVTPIVVSASNGKLLSYGNLWNTKNNAYTLRLTQNSDDLVVSGKDGIHYYSAFPTDATAVFVYLLTYNTGNAATPSTFVCLLSGSFAATGCGATDARLYSVGSYNYNLNTLVHDATQGWRTYSTTGVDTFATTDLGGNWNALAAWDFDGYYGPKDNGTGNGAKYNAGAFESLP